MRVYLELKFMKIFDRDNDGDFDIKDILIICTLGTTVMNLVLNFFSVLDIGVVFTNQTKPVIECSVVKIGDQNKLKCFRAEDKLPQLPTAIDN